MKDILKKIEKIGVIPVIKLEKIEDTLPLAEALYEGGLPCAEITFRTDICATAIRLMKDKYPEMITDISEMYETKLLLQEVLRYYIYQELDMKYKYKNF